MIRAILTSGSMRSLRQTPGQIVCYETWTYLVSPTQTGRCAGLSRWASLLGPPWHHSWAACPRFHTLATAFRLTSSSAPCGCTMNEPPWRSAALEGHDQSVDA